MVRVRFAQQRPHGIDARAKSPALLAWHQIVDDRRYARDAR